MGNIKAKQKKENKDINEAIDILAQLFVCLIDEKNSPKSLKSPYVEQKDTKLVLPIP